MDDSHPVHATNTRRCTVSHDMNESTEPEKARGSASLEGNDNVRQEPATQEQAAKPSIS